jgi:probable phosphoglycerate mutase
MTDLWLIRHGETEWSLAGKHTGRTDIPLTPHGEQQAEWVHQHLKSKTFAHVFVSPLIRARETCRIAGFGDVAEVEPDLQEWDYGSMEGRISADIQREIPNWNIWTHGVALGETPAQIGARVDRVIARAMAFQGEVALFAHGHVLRVLTARWLGLNPEEGRLFLLEPAGLSILGHEHDTRVLRLWNEAPRERR